LGGTHNAAEIAAVSELEAGDDRYWFAVHHATKRITRNPKTGEIKNRSYDREHHFRVEIIPVADFTALCDALGRLTREPFAFVVRGAPVPGINLAYTRRLLHPDKKSGDPATFTAAPQHWFAIDMDHIAAAVLTDPAADADSAIEYLIGLLPGELADASCWWQFTASQSLPGHEETLSARLWYRSTEPLGDADLKRWAAAANGATKLIDGALYSPVQAHYIAAPTFNGMADPLPRRWGVRTGLETEVSLIIPPPDPKNPEIVSGQGYEPGRGVQAFLADIGGGRGFRDPIKATIASYIAIYGSKADCEPLKAAICKAIERAEAGGRSSDQIARYRSDEYLDDLIRWTRERHGDQPPKGWTVGPPPHIVDPDIPLDEPEAQSNWYSQCLVGSDGRTLSNLSNTLLALSEDRVWRGALARNGLLDAALLVKKLPNHRNGGSA
jgi:hypothetical protein